MVTAAPSLSRWTGEFLDEGMEEAYLRDAWPRLGRQIRLVLSFAGVMYLGALYLDYVELNSRPAFYLMTVLRIWVGGMLASALLVSTRPRPLFRWVMVGSMLSIGVTELVEDYLLHSDPGGFAGLPFILVILLMAYVMAPNRVWMTGLAAFIVSCLFLGYQVSLVGWGSSSTFMMFLYLVMANGTGYVFQLSWNRVARRDFALRLELEHQVTERRRAEDAAKQANAAKSRFLAVMSHEIRTPLNGVLGGVQLLQETELSEEQRQPLDIVAHSGNQLAKLLDDILDLARIEADHLNLEEDSFALAELMASVHAVLYSQAKAKGLALRLEHPDFMPEALVGDALRLRQVLINLAGNAVKFTERGEVVVGVALEPVCGQAGRVRCIFSVTDTGPGLDPQAQSRVFAPFEQGDDSIRRRHGGTGLGLTISRELVAAMGGELSLASLPGEGSTFRFEVEFPLGVPRETSAPEPMSGRSLLVLVVDDLVANRIVAAGLLKSLGHRSQEASSGAEALAVLRERVFDAVLLDLHMPDMDGMEVFRCIQECPGLAVKPAVFLLTADTERNLLQSCLAAGMQGIIPKPIRKERLRVQLSDLAVPGEDIPEDEVPLVDRAQLDQVLADLGVEVWCAGLTACRSSAEACLEEMGDTALLDKALHRLAGLSASYAMPRLYQAVIRAQTTGSLPSREALQSLVTTSLAELEATTGVASSQG